MSEQQVEEKLPFVLVLSGRAFLDSKDSLRCDKLHESCLRGIVLRLIQARHDAAFFVGDQRLVDLQVALLVHHQASSRESLTMYLMVSILSAPTDIAAIIREALDVQGNGCSAGKN